jgi:hypothetical protein
MKILGMSGLRKPAVVGYVVVELPNIQSIGQFTMTAPTVRNILTAGSIIRRQARKFTLMLRLGIE